MPIKVKLSLQLSLTPHDCLVSVTPEIEKCTILTLFVSELRIIEGFDDNPLLTFWHFPKAA